MVCSLQLLGDKLALPFLVLAICIFYMLKFVIRSVKGEPLCDSWEVFEIKYADVLLLAYILFPQKLFGSPFTIMVHWLKTWLFNFSTFAVYFQNNKNSYLSNLIRFRFYVFKLWGFLYKKRGDFSSFRTTTQKCFQQFLLKLRKLFISVVYCSFLIFIHFYVRFMGIMFSGLCFRLSVRASVCLSRFRLKFLVQVVLDEVEVQWTSSLVHMFLRIWSFKLNAKLEILPHFHGPLNIENDNADWPSVYFGHILVYFKLLIYGIFFQKKGMIFQLSGNIFYLKNFGQFSWNFGDWYIYEDKLPLIFYKFLIW